MCFFLIAVNIFCCNCWHLQEEHFKKKVSALPSDSKSSHTFILLDKLVNRCTTHKLAVSHSLERSLFQFMFIFIYYFSLEYIFMQSYCDELFTIEYICMRLHCDELLKSHRNDAKTRRNTLWTPWPRFYFSLPSSTRLNQIRVFNIYCNNYSCWSQDGIS